MNYYLILYPIVMLFSTIIILLMSGKKMPRKLIAKKVIFTTLLCYVLSITIIRLVFNQSVFIVKDQMQFIIYSVSLIVLTCLQFVGILYFKKEDKEKNDVKIHKGIQVVFGVSKVVIALLLTMSLFLFCFALWFFDFFGSPPPEQFFFSLNSPFTGTSPEVANYLYHTPYLLAGCSLILSMYAFFLPVVNFTKKTKWYQTGSAIRTIILVVVSSVVIVFCTNYGVASLKLAEVYRAYGTYSTYIEKNYVHPHKANLKFPDKKRNLIHIYAESLESSYLSKELGGYMDENLMPHLTELSKEGVHFSNNEKMGGSYQTYGSSWSVAAMVNMESGIPVKIALNGKSYGLANEFFPGLTNLGDILHEQGYNQTIMFGADAEFGGLEVYFNDHGKYHIFDVKEARKQKLIPEDYNVWWGFEDDKLYGFAQNEITRLANEGKPFHFNMENADTHFPDGYASKNLKRSRASQYADVIAYSDEQIVQFVKWIQAQPFYENTTVVITGDHLSMDKKFFQNFDASYHRAPVNLFLNLPFDTKEINRTNRQFSPVDMFPTIVSSIGVDIPEERLGLGTNLFSKEKTLIERDGLEIFNTEISKRSTYYDTYFLENRREEKSTS